MAAKKYKIITEKISNDSRTEVRGSVLGFYGRSGNQELLCKQQVLCLLLSEVKKIKSNSNKCGWGVRERNKTGPWEHL